ncbi:unnamed protein product [Amoebophrya sp. A120]|nr:unnamed protein product [Amoebophrya sp. A120]|eukprot:GSA120T00008326001.1
MNPEVLKEKLHSIVSDNRSYASEHKELFDRARELMENPEELEKNLAIIAKESPVGQLLALETLEQAADNESDTQSEQGLLQAHENDEKTNTKLKSKVDKLQKKIEQVQIEQRIAKQADQILHQVKDSMVNYKFDDEFNAWREKVWAQALSQQEAEEDRFAEADGKPRSWVLLRHLDENGEQITQEVGDIFRRDVETINPVQHDYRNDPIVRKTKRHSWLFFSPSKWCGLLNKKGSGGDGRTNNGHKNYMMTSASGVAKWKELSASESSNAWNFLTRSAMVNTVFAVLLAIGFVVGILLYSVSLGGKSDGVVAAAGALADPTVVLQGGASGRVGELGAVVPKTDLGSSHVTSAGGVSSVVETNALTAPVARGRAEIAAASPTSSGVGAKRTLLPRLQASAAGSSLDVEEQAEADMSLYSAMKQRTSRRSAGIV